MPEITVWTGTVKNVNHPGFGYAVNDTLVDPFGGAYTVATVDSLGRIQTVTTTTAPLAYGGTPNALDYLTTSSSAKGNGAVSLQLIWTNQGSTLMDALNGAITLGGSALATQAIASGTVSISGAAVGQAVLVTPAAYPGNSIQWHGLVSSANTVTVYIENLASGSVTPTSTNYYVKLIA